VKKTGKECAEWEKRANIKGREAENELEYIKVKEHEGVGKVGRNKWR
jgi:hypothetical protein